MQTYYGVYQNSDLTEGRGAMVLIGIFTDVNNANEVADHYCLKDPAGRGGEVRSITVYENILEFARTERNAVARNALAANDSEYQEYLRLKDKFE